MELKVVLKARDKICGADPATRLQNVKGGKCVWNIVENTWRLHYKVAAIAAYTRSRSTRNVCCLFLTCC